MGIKHHFYELGKDIVTYGIWSALSRLSGLLLLPFLTRIFSVDEYGVVDVLAALISLLTTFLTFAFPSAIARYFGDIPIHERGRLVTALLVFVAGAGLLGVSGVSLYASALAEILLKNRDYAVLLQAGCWVALFNSLTAIPQMVLRLERRIVSFNLISILSSMLYLILALFFVLRKRWGIEGVFLAQVVSSALSLAISLCLVKKYLARNISLHELVRVLKYSLPMFPATLVGWVNSQVDRILLLPMVGLGGVAIFGAATKIAGIFQFLVLVFRQAWHPYSMSIITSPDRNRVYCYTLNLYAGLFASLSLAVTAVSPELFAVLLPATYHSGYVVVPWLMGAAILHQSASVTNLGILIGEKTARVSFAAWVGVGVNLVSSFFLIKSFDVAGAAIGTFGAELVFTGLLLYFSTREAGIKFEISAILVILGIYILATIWLLAVARTVLSPYSILYRVIIALISTALIAFRVFDRSARSAVYASLLAVFARRSKGGN